MNTIWNGASSKNFVRADKIRKRITTLSDEIHKYLEFILLSVNRQTDGKGI